jgi:hypothetical protein
MRSQLLNNEGRIRHSSKMCLSKSSVTLIDSEIVSLLALNGPGCLHSRLTAFRVAAMEAATASERVNFILSFVLVWN